MQTTLAKIVGLLSEGGIPISVILAIGLVVFLIVAKTVHKIVKWIIALAVIGIIVILLLHNPNIALKVKQLSML